MAVSCEEEMRRCSSHGHPSTSETNRFDKTCVFVSHPSWRSELASFPPISRVGAKDVATQVLNVLEMLVWPGVEGSLPVHPIQTGGKLSCRDDFLLQLVLVDLSAIVIEWL